MHGVRIVADTASDIPADMAAEHGIELVPLTVRFGTEELVDRRDLSAAEFWSRLANSSVLPETAAPSPGAFEEVYRRAAADGAEGVVCVTISSALSATYEAARLAAEAVADTVAVRVVDSRAVSMAEGTVALAAAELAAAGKGLDDVTAGAEAMVPRTRTFAALDTLDNLRKGGRIGAAQALLGSMLSIKPIIQVTGGKVEAESKQRTRSRSLRYLADKVREAGAVEHLTVLHGGAPDIDVLVDMLADVCPRDTIVVADVGAVIGTHAGPRVIGVTFAVP
ncbi:MAG TPA: DegV family protein [Acidimicrobiales bacterium]|nr:DegV family protein [Acidimicrobiales bacterium]